MRRRAARMAGQAVSGAARGAVVAHQQRQLAEQGLEADIARSQDPMAQAEAIMAVRRQRAHHRLVAGGLVGALLLGAGGAAWKYGPDVLHHFLGGAVPKPVITELQIDNTITGIHEDLRTPIDTVTGQASARVTHAEHWLWFNVPGSADQTGIAVKAQDYAAKNPKTGLPETVHAGFDVHALPNAIMLSGRRNPANGKPQIVATIDPTQFQGELTGQRYTTPDELNGNGDKPILWRIVQSGDKTNWAVQATDFANEELSAHAAEVAPAGIPAGVAVQIKKWGKNEINELKALGGSPSDISILQQALTQPVEERFVGVNEQHPQIQHLVNPSTIGVAYPPLDSAEQTMLQQHDVTGGGQTFDTYIADQEINKIKDQPGLFEVAGDFEGWPAAA